MNHSWWLKIQEDDYRRFLSKIHSQNKIHGFMYASSSSLTAIEWEFLNQLKKKKYVVSNRASENCQFEKIILTESGHEEVFITLI